MLDSWVMEEDVNKIWMVKVFLKKEVLWDPLLKMVKKVYKVKDLMDINLKNLKKGTNKVTNNKGINNKGINNKGINNKGINNKGINKVMLIEDI